LDKKGNSLQKFQWLFINLKAGGRGTNKEDDLIRGRDPLKGLTLENHSQF
jgi:hypothetical protein